MSVKTQTKKDQVISGLVEVRGKILDTGSALPPEKQDKLFLGSWSVKDLLAHLVGWDFTNIEAVEEILADKLPSFYAAYDPDWQSYNARLVTSYKKDDFADLLSLAEHSHQELIDFLKTVPAEAYDQDKGLHFRRYKVTIARLLQAEIDDEEIHYRQVKEYVYN